MKILIKKPLRSKTTCNQTTESDNFAVEGVKTTIIVSTSQLEWSIKEIIVRTKDLWCFPYDSWVNNSSDFTAFSSDNSLLYLVIVKPKLLVRNFWRQEWQGSSIMFSIWHTYTRTNQINSYVTCVLVKPINRDTKKNYKAQRQTDAERQYLNEQKITRNITPLNNQPRLFLFKNSSFKSCSFSQSFNEFRASY